MGFVDYLLSGFMPWMNWARVASRIMISNIGVFPFPVKSSPYGLLSVFTHRDAKSLCVSNRTRTTFRRLYDAPTRS